MRLLTQNLDKLRPKINIPLQDRKKNIGVDVDTFLEKNIEAVGKIARSAVHDATNTETFFTAKEIKTLLKRHFIEAERQGAFRTPKKHDRKTFIKASADRVMRTLTKDEKICPAYEKNGEILYTAPQLIEAEKTIADFVSQTARKSTKKKSSSLLEGSVHLNNAYKEQFGYVPLKDHADGVRQALKEDRGLTIVDGAPGCGKTAIAQGVMVGKMIEARGKSLTIIATAPTGKAAGSFEADLKEMADFIKPYIKTSVKVIGMPLDQSIRKMQKNEFPENSIVMMDEAGMLGTKTMAAFLGGTKKNNMETLIIGDASQIQPETAGHGFRQLVETAEKNNLPFVRLTINLRQKFKEDKEAAHLIREGKTGEGMSVFRNKTYADNQKSLNFVEKESEALQKAAEGYVRFHQKNPDKEAVMIASSDDQAAEANRLIRSEMKRAGTLGAERSYGTGKNKQEIAIGDRLIVRRTVLLGPGRGRVNPGTTAVVKGFGNGRRVKLELEDGRKASLIQRPGKMEHAHALSLRESQGMSKDAAFVAVTKEIDGAEALVAMTRHKTKVVTHVPKTIYPDFETLSEKIKMTKKAIVSDITEPTPPPPSKYSYATQIRQSLMRDILADRQRSR